VHLDKSGKRITGNLAERYVLHKLREATLLETKWVLVELMGKPVKNADAKQPSILLTREGSKLNGFGGCNTIRGSYTQEKGNRITFSSIVTTLRSCDAMETETELLKVLQTTDSYSIKGNVLQLQRARMARMARFEAIRQE
jgi:copper homeostasis protein (lipoprotein)